jgi:AhpC/TSA family
VIGLSCSSQSKHDEWICDVNQIMQCQVGFPIISDVSRDIAKLYNMLDFQEVSNRDELGNPYTHRSVFIIDPKNVIRAQITYPLSTGRNFDEVTRLLDSLILYDSHNLATGSKWKSGSGAFVLGSDEEAKMVKLVINIRSLKVLRKLRNIIVLFKSQLQPNRNYDLAFYQSIVINDRLFMASLLSVRTKYLYCTKTYSRFSNNPQYKPPQWLDLIL